MSTAAISFGEIECTTNRTLAYAILASQAAKNYIAAVYRLREVVGLLERLLSVLSEDNVDSLNPVQKAWVATKLQEIHKHLAPFSRSPEAAKICGLKVPWLSDLAIKIQELTEDIDDVIEDLVLVSDLEFQGLIAACKVSIGLPTEDAGAVLHN
jgi:hypothetical protein